MIKNNFILVWINNGYLNLEYDQKVAAAPAGFEPATLRLTGGRSTIELQGRVFLSA